MKWKIFQCLKFLFRHSSNSRKLSRQKFHNELAYLFTAYYGSKNADWNHQQLTDGGVLANRNSTNHPAEISWRTRVCIHCVLRKQKCRLKSTTTNGWRRFGQSEQRKSSVLFPIQSEKSPDSGFFACDLWKKCIMPSFRKQITEIKGEGIIAG